MNAHTQTPDRRPPARFIPAALLGSVPPIVGLAVAAALATHGERTWLALLAGGFAVGRLGIPIYQYMSVRYRTTNEGIHYSTGLLLQRTRFVRWETLGTLEVSVPWNFRPTGLARVSILQSGEDTGRIEIPAVTQAEAAHLVLQQRRADRGASQEDEAPTADDSVVFRASVADLAIASGVYGKFAVLGAAIAVSTVDLVRSFGFLPSALPSGGLGIALVGVGAALAIMLAGVAATVVRHYDLRTIDTGDSLEIHQGLLSTQRRILDGQHVIGVQIKRNLVEALLGRSRLTALSLDTSVGLGTNLVLPSLRDPLVAEIIERSFTDRLGESVWSDVDRRELVSRIIGAAIVTFAAAGTVATLSVLLGLPGGVTIGTALLSTLFIKGAGEILSRRLVATSSAAIINSTFLSHKRAVLELDAIHAVSSIGFKSKICLATLHYYSGMAHAVRILNASPDQLRKVVGA